MYHEKTAFPVAGAAGSRGHDRPDACRVPHRAARRHDVEARRAIPGTSEIIDANPQVANPNLIYPGNVLTIPETDASVRACEQEVIRLVNAERAKHGLAALTEDWELSRVARYKSQDMHDNRYFAHNSPTYGTPFRMLRAFGLSYRTAGENIAMGYAAPAAVVAGWMNSEGHRANILSSAYTKIGVGYVADGHYWTQQFIG